MALKFKYPSLEQIPAEVAGLYQEKDGAFVLDLEGAVEKSRLDEFGNNNIELQRQVQELTQQFEGIDAGRARELLKKQQELDEQNLIKKGDLAALIESKVNPLKSDLERERQRNQQLQAQLDGSRLSDALRSAGGKAGVRPTAVPDLLARSGGVFKVVDGQVVGVDSGMTMDLWIENLRSEAPHLFEQNSGGGAAGNGSGGAGWIRGKKNPWAKETWNLTEQSRISRENPTLAKAFAAAAGR
jgi:hypothetical protein